MIFECERSTTKVETNITRTILHQGEVREALEMNCEEGLAKEIWQIEWFLKMPNNAND